MKNCVALLATLGLFCSTAAAILDSAEGNRRFIFDENPASENRMTGEDGTLEFGQTTSNDLNQTLTKFISKVRSLLRQKDYDNWRHSFELFNLHFQLSMNYLGESDNALVLDNINHKDYESYTMYCGNLIGRNMRHNFTWSGYSLKDRALNGNGVLHVGIYQIGFCLVHYKGTDSWFPGPLNLRDYNSIYFQSEDKNFRSYVGDFGWSAFHLTRTYFEIYLSVLSQAIAEAGSTPGSNRYARLMEETPKMFKETNWS